MMNRKLIILDRDGVINRDSDKYIKTPDEWEAIPGSMEAIARLCRADYRVVVITNQSGIGRGLFTINTLNKIHQKMIDKITVSGGELSAVFFCPHMDEDQCGCRKPKPGLFLDVADRLRYDISDVFAVGDSLRDLQAALGGGAKPILVRTGNGRQTEQKLRQISLAKEQSDGTVMDNTSSMIDEQNEVCSLDERLRGVPVYDDLSSFVDKLLHEE